jgi:hypothetical protein
MNQFGSMFYQKNDTLDMRLGQIKDIQSKSKLNPLLDG